ncbi:MAG: PD-(D/E)XK nuclease family transposase, partial [Pyrinomonadaceae bacterium]|nr:PD-(D/E)XK nuclease family transposase [Pyrinomonadaceae bacterium]
ETEKAFIPKIGNIAFKYDVFAETDDKRMIIEIQKVDYDHNFDRFLHYHLQGITEQQRNSKNYTIPRTVYTIIFFTAPYTIEEKSGKPIQDEFLLSSLNPKNIKGFERDIYGHQLIFLNPNYRNVETPANIKDWLDLVYESIHNPEHPNINLSKSAIRKVSELIDYDDMSPEEITASKDEESRKETLAIYEEKGLKQGLKEGREEGLKEGEEKGKREEQRVIAKNLLALGVAEQTIFDATGLTLSEIEQLN